MHVRDVSNIPGRYMLGTRYHSGFCYLSVPMQDYLLIASLHTRLLLVGGLAQEHSGSQKRVVLYYGDVSSSDLCRMHAYISVLTPPGYPKMAPDATWSTLDISLGKERVLYY